MATPAEPMGLVERIERATLDAVSPAQLHECPGWLLPMDPGTVGRAHSAAPTTHDAPEPAVLDDIVQRYRAAGWTPVLRLPDLPDWHAAYAHLERLGWQRTKPTCVMTARVDVVHARATAVLAPEVVVTLQDHASAPWMDLFLGPGLDPVDGAWRAQALARSAATRFGGVHVGGVMVACGAACFSQGLLSAHGLRTHQDYRRQGLASALLAAMAASALAHGLQEAFLQVEAHNPARSLYERLGFTLAWQYAYWRPALSAGSHP